MSERKESRDDGDDKEDFQSHFPVLYREIMEGEDKIQEDEIRTPAGSKKARKFKGHTPGVIDFICRCSTEEEALEIIEYMFKKGDVSEGHTNELKKQLKEKGLEFFGKHQKPGYYEKA